MAAFTGIGGRLRVESVVVFAWNQWSASPGIRTPMPDLESCLPPEARVQIDFLRFWDPAVARKASATDVVLHALELAVANLKTKPFHGHEDLTELPNVELPDWPKAYADMLRKTRSGGGSPGGSAGGRGGGSSL